MEQTSEQRQALERNIVRHLIDTAMAAGWTVPAVYDGENRVKCATPEAVMDTVFSVDESTIMFKKGADKSHCVVIILGNGIDCISDHSIGGDFQQEIMDISDAYVEQLEANGSVIAALESQRADLLAQTIADIMFMAADQAQSEHPIHWNKCLDDIKELCRMATLAEGGKIAMVESGRDCDGVEYNGTVHIVEASKAAIDALYDQIHEWADGPFRLEMCRVSESKGVKYESRDLVMEAHENGHRHTIVSSFP